MGYLKNPKVKLICKTCGKEFEVYDLRKDTAKYCSKKCYGRSMVERNKGNKHGVGHKAPWLTELNQIPGRNAKVAQRKKEIAAGDTTPRLSGLRGTNIMKYIRKYEKHAYDSPKPRKETKKPYLLEGGRFEHRVIMETLLCRELTFDDVVHHIDGDTKHNSISNLVVMTRADHSKMHTLERRGRGDASDD